MTTTTARTDGPGAVSRRAALRGIGGAGLAALGVAAPGGDPAAVVAAYVEAINASDLAAILRLYADDAVHVALPTADGSAGVCLGKAHVRMWYERSVADGDRIAPMDDTLAVAGNQAAFAARIASDPWRALGIEALEANAELVVIGGRIATHMVVLSPESVRELLAAQGTVPKQPAVGEPEADHHRHGPR